MFVAIGAANISSSALQLTPDSANINTMVTFTSGRVLLNQRFKLWADNATQHKLGSFNTSFLFNVYTASGEVSQGLAFVIAPDLRLPLNSNGPFLGLTSSTTDGHQANKLVAVELDSFKDDFDPDDNHVGIDVNSVRSLWTQSLTPHNINLTSMGAKFYSVWVDYDGLNKLIHVYIAEQADREGATPPKPASPILSAELNLRDYVDEYSYIGFSASTGYSKALNSVLHRDNKLVEAVDERLGSEYLKEEGEMLLLLGLACSHPNGSERPNTQDILRIIAGTMPVPDVPPFKPAFRWAAVVADSVNADEVTGVDSVNTMSVTVSDFLR